jgi:hypothetical protein
MSRQTLQFKFLNSFQHNKSKCKSGIILCQEINQSDFGCGLFYSKPRKIYFFAHFWGGIITYIIALVSDFELLDEAWINKYKDNWWNRPAMAI